MQLRDGDLRVIKVEIRALISRRLSNLHRSNPCMGAFDEVLFITISSGRIEAKPTCTTKEAQC
jgi:hypothetical protein